MNMYVVPWTSGPNFIASCVAESFVDSSTYLPGVLINRVWILDYRRMFEL